MNLGQETLGDPVKESLLNMEPLLFWQRAGSGTTPGTFQTGLELTDPHITRKYRGVRNPINKVPVWIIPGEVGLVLLMEDASIHRII